MIRPVDGTHTESRSGGWPGQLRALDTILAALRDGLGAMWGEGDGAGGDQIRLHRQRQR